jgi:hypothetical protein
MDRLFRTKFAPTALVRNVPAPGMLQAQLLPDGSGRYVANFLGGRVALFTFDGQLIDEIQGDPSVLPEATFRLERISADRIYVVQIVGLTT